MLLKLLAFLGAGFDCASKNEIARVLELGVAPHRIIFANPCKQASNIRFAYKSGVDYMTFDNEAELYKIKQHHPNAKVVLRIITNDANAVCRFSMKFGADMASSLRLIELATQLDLDLAGVSFHVGSGQMSPEAFSESISNARKLFDYAREQFGCKMRLLDLGGGYPGSSESGELFSAIAKEINHALEEFFPAEYFAKINGNDDENKLRIIAEPGRYYACSAFTLCVNVIAKRVMDQDEQQQLEDSDALAQTPNIMVAEASSDLVYETKRSVDTSKSIMYYINDGAYASFNCLFYDHAVCTPMIIRDDMRSGVGDQSRLYKSSVWGPTCDGLDLVVKEIYLPECDTEEFMVFKNMGAYTLSGAVAFNGIPLARCIYVASTSWDTIKNAFVETPAEECGIFSPSATCGASDLAFSRALSNIQQQCVDVATQSDSDSDECGSSDEHSGAESEVCSNNGDDEIVGLDNDNAAAEVNNNCAITC